MDAPRANTAFAFADQAQDRERHRALAAAGRPDQPDRLTRLKCCRVSRKSLPSAGVQRPWDT